MCTDAPMKARHIGSVASKPRASRSLRLGVGPFLGCETSIPPKGVTMWWKLPPRGPVVGPEGHLADGVRGMSARPAKGLQAFRGAEDDDRGGRPFREMSAIPGDEDRVSGRRDL